MRCSAGLWTAGRSRWVVGVVGGLLLAACRGGGSSVSSGSAPSAPALRVAGSVELRVSPSAPAALSPDGGWVVYAGDGKRACVQPADGGAARCSAAGSAPVAERYRWSPDSAAVVFSDDWIRQEHEPDLYLLRVASMTVTALTPDQRVELIGDERPGFADVLGQAGADGQVRFLRATGRDAAAGVEPCSIAESGGAVRCGSVLAVGLSALVDAAWSHDGNRVAYLDQGTTGASATTLHVAGADGHEQWSRPGPGGDQPWGRLAFSADDRYLLLGPSHGVVSPPGAVVVPAGGGDPVPVSRDPVASFPAWSPTGSALAFTSTPTGSSGEAAGGVWLVGAVGATPRRLTDRRLAPLSNDLGMSWGAGHLAGRDAETAAVVVLRLDG